ncbi:hydrogenase maturation protease [Parvibaculum sedimenti]|uniref:Hydrogenase maturation protease n=1 Tax=Parvibaculum sedimenti TaxID=2608632 RepID=A0A6N6VH11_9HYPH|nr:hydrogenase maturation protease [Parvibaculum sedimenti]KAB7738980.1 hydrogenase maturation protease [Parvibaculum sedimenti]
MRRLVIGIGNSDRGDDGAGLAAARELARNIPQVVTVVESRGEPAGLIDQWQKADVVFLVDACASGVAPGTIHRFDARLAPLPEHFGAVSTHGFGIGAAVELARAIGSLPASLIVYGIEAGSFEPGAWLSPPVAKAALDVAARIADELACLST